MSEIKNGRLGVYGVEHSKCNRVMTLGFEGLNACFWRSQTWHGQWKAVRRELESASTASVTVSRSAIVSDIAVAIRLW